ncbi:MAG: TolC family protein [Anaerolineae bacterium]|nr:TolC family protein [Phycisphaerae bacterium]
MNTSLKSALLAAAIALIGGCAAMPKDSGFHDVRSAVEQRSGQRVQWNRFSADDHDLDAAVRDLIAQPLTADRAVQIALINNRSLQSTYEELGVAQAELVQAGLLKNPVFDADAKFLEGGGGTIVELSVMQSFLDIFFIPLRKRIASGAFEVAKLRVAGAAVDLVAEVREAYYAHVAAEQVLELRRTVVSATDAAYGLSRRIHDAGNNTALDVAQERALYEQSKLELAHGESTVLDTRERLNALLGLWGTNTTWTINERLGDPPAEESPAAEIERRAVESNLLLAAMKHQLDGAAITLGLRRSTAWLSEAEVGVAAEREPEGTWAFGPAISAPIPLFDQGQASTAIARSEFERIRQHYFATAIEVRSAARSARNRLMAARARAEYLRQVILPLRQEITHETQLQYNAMQVGAFQLLAAKQNEIEAGVQYIESLREYWIARSAFEQVTSGSIHTKVSQ